MDLSLIGREEALFEDDVNKKSVLLQTIVTQSAFLVIGGAGTIGKAVTLEIFKRDPKRLHVVDISENNLVELVRDIRSTEGYGTGDFKTFAVDCGSVEFEALFENGQISRYFLISDSSIKFFLFASYFPSSFKCISKSVSEIEAHTPHPTHRPRSITFEVNKLASLCIVQVF